MNSSSMAQDSASSVDFFSRCTATSGWRWRRVANTDGEDGSAFARAAAIASSSRRPASRCWSTDRTTSTSDAA